MSEFKKFKSAIFGQESGNGTADTSSPNYAGALGKGQILEKTFNGLKANGKIPANYEWTNPAHNEEAAGKYMEEAWGAGNGNPELAAAYYYGGPKAIKGGVINTFRDLKNSKAPTTNEYAASVVKRMGLTPTVASQGTGKSVSEFDALIERGVQASILSPTNRKLADAKFEQANFERGIIEESRPTGFEMFGAGVAGNTQQRIVNGIVDRIFSPAFEAEPDFKPDHTQLPYGADSDLIEQYGTAKSQAQADYILQKYNDEQLRSKTMMDRGIGTGLALGFAAEGVAPINLVAPFAAAKGLQAFGLGSLALAQEGRAVASVGAAIGENVVGGTVLEAVAQGLDGRYKPRDLLVSLAADSLIGLGTGAWGARAVAHAERAIAKAATESVTHDAEQMARAAAQFGPNANADDLRKASDLLFAKDSNDLVRDAISGPDANRKLATDLEAPAGWGKVEADRPAVAKPNGPDPRFGQIDEALTEDYVKAQKPGISLSPTVADDPIFKALAKDADVLFKQFLPADHRIVLTRATEVVLPSGDKGTPAGIHMSVGPDAAVIVLEPSALAKGTLAHEIGHAVDYAWRNKVDPNIKNGVLDFYAHWLGTYDREGYAKTALIQRGPTYRLGTQFNPAAAVDELGEPVSLRDMRVKEFGEKYSDEYYNKFSEFMAEQFNKYIEANALGAGSNKDLKLTDGLIEFAKANLARLIEVFKRALKLGFLRPDARVEDFFDEVFRLATAERNGAAVPGQAVPSTTDFAQNAKPASVVDQFMTDPVAIKYGLTLAPMGTATERKQAQAMLALHKVAEKWEASNPRDEAYLARVQNLADNNVFNVASAGLIMLKSESPLVRMTAAMLLEDASGVTGKRQATAAIAKYYTERMMTANVANDLEGAYQHWVSGRPGGLRDELVGGTNRAAYNKEIAAEIEARRKAGGPVTQDPNIKAAADSVEAAYQRIANAQRSANTLGSEGLPKSSVGYMPHKMSPTAVINLTNEQANIVHSALVDQFITIEGWDITFSDKLASSYMKRVRDRAAGDYSSSIGGAQGANQVEEALQGMGLPEDQVKKYMQSFTKGAANFTKGRIELDLNKVYNTADGEFRLLDIFETDQLELVRSQAGRASGEVALTRFGVQGKPGLKLLRDAMQYGQDGAKVSVRENEAFDQIAAEFLNEPFGNQGSKFMHRATMANTLVRLGGNAITQMAESINGIFHVGAAATLESIGSMPRLRREVIALSKGEKVDNPLLGSIEFATGAEFGTDSYKVSMPYDNPNSLYPTYGKDTLTLTDRLLRGGGHLQAKLSGWRAVHATQQRGMAEQIVLKSMRFLRDGGEDKALADMGFTPELAAALRKDMDKFATFDASGRLSKLDVTKIEDPDLREQMIQAVWRGTQQIIQGTFIGERGKWVHDGWMQMMTQFRGFSITSMEKQWGRKRNTHGSFAAFGMLVGSMSIAAPIYMARTYAASIGRPDQQEFLEQRLTPEAIGRATLNYVAMSGMAGDFLDLVTATLPEELGVAPTGGRAGVESDFVGNYILPASSLVDDIWKYAQSPLKAEDAAKIMPGSRLPYLVPFLNLTKE